MSTITKPQSWKEGRRMRAFELKEQGWKQIQIAEALGVTRGAVSQWLRRAREGGGIEALRHHPAPGPTPHLSVDQLAQLPELLSKGAEHYGFIGQVWTGSRVATLIKDVFGVRYHPTHARRLLRAAGWSSQKPIQRATQRNDEAIEKWASERWPEIKRGRRMKEEPSSG
jgi:transposase